MLDRPELSPEAEKVRKMEHMQYFGHKKFATDVDQANIQNQLNDFGVSNLVTEVAVSEDGRLNESFDCLILCD